MKKPGFFQKTLSCTFFFYFKAIDGMKVLVCEDDEMVLKMVEFKLQKEGHEVSLANDGKRP